MNIDIYSPKKAQTDSSGVSYPGFVSNRKNSLGSEVRCYNLTHFSLVSGDLVTILNEHGGSTAIVAAVDETGKNVATEVGLSALKLQENPLTGLEIKDFTKWLGERHLSASDVNFYQLFDVLTEPQSDFIFKSELNCELWIGAPSPEDMMENGGGNTLSVFISSESIDRDRKLPKPLAKVKEEFTIKRASAHAYKVKKGEYIQIIDIEGQQCSDFIAFPQHSLDDGLERFIDSTVTRTMVGSAYPQPGLFDKFYDQDMQPLLALVQDTVGRHDTFALACTARGYEARGYPGHINCSDNISTAVKPYGISQRRAWPAINLFFNSWILPHDNHLSSDEAWSRPGDYVVMQALTDLLCVSTACPDDIDPINGWNPTDIHVRIYESSEKIEKAIAHRPYTESEVIMTEYSAFHPRTSELTQTFHVARDLWLPNSYESTRAMEEYWACRESVTVQDMSSLRKFDIVGPDAQQLLQLTMSKNIAKLSINRGLYGLILSDTGAVIDDGTLFRLGHELFRWCCGSDESGKQLRAIAEQHNLKVWIKSIWSSMPNLAVQGPKSRELLKKIVFTDVHQPDLDNVKWFGFTIGRLFDRDGPVFMLTRTGFTGELGYEIFCDHTHALEIWDAIMEAGQEFDIKPMGGEALSMIRIEAGLMVAGAEFGDDIDALEAGLEFAVDFDKEEFVGKTALERNKASQKRKLVGLIFDSNIVPHHGDPIYFGQFQVGVITSATYSPMLEKPIAMARLSVEYSHTDVKLEVGQLDGRMKRLSATVTTLPFIDPQRKRARA